MEAATRPLPRRERPLHPVAFVAMLGVLSAIGPTAFDIYIPALPEIGRELDASQAVVGLSITSYLVGLAAGQVVTGPVSDVLGRRRPLFWSLALLAVATLACALAPSIELLIVARLFQGLTAAAGMVTARAVIRDLYAGAAGAKVLSQIILVYGLAPVLAPVIGAQVLVLTEWRGIFWALLGVIGLLAAATAWLLPETLTAERRRSHIRHVGADFGALLRDRVFVGFALAVGFGTAAVVSYMSAASFVIQDLYGASVGLFGALFGIFAVGILAGSQLNVRLLTHHPPRRLLDVAVVVLVLDGAVMLALALLEAPLWAIGPTFFVLMFSWGLVPGNAVALAMVEHADRAGSASALVGVSQYGVAALVAPLIGVAGDSSAVPMAAAVFVSALLCAAAVRGLSGRR